MRTGAVPLCSDQGTQVPVRLQLQLDMSPAFQALSNGGSSRANSERQAKLKIYKYLRRQVALNPYLRNDPGSENLIVVRLRLLDDTKDAEQSDWSMASIYWSLLSLFVLPMYQRIDDTIELRASPGLRNYASQYNFARRQYLSWFLIPYNLLINPFVGRQGITISTVEFDAALRNLTPRIQQDLSVLACAFGASQKSDGETQVLNQKFR